MTDRFLEHQHNRRRSDQERILLARYREEHARLLAINGELVAVLVRILEVTNEPVIHNMAEAAMARVSIDDLWTPPVREPHDRLPNKYWC